jgi:hypothetical protein
MEELVAAVSCGDLRLVMNAVESGSVDPNVILKFVVSV